MTDMINFSIDMLGNIANFLIAPPIIYILGMILLCFVAKTIKILIK